MSYRLALPTMEFGSVFEVTLRYYSVHKDPYTEAEVKTPVDLTGYGAVMDIEVDGVDVLTLSTSNGRISLVGNEVRLFVSATDTKTVSFDEADYDLLLLPSNDVSLAKRFVYGSIRGEAVVTDI